MLRSHVRLLKWLIGIWSVGYGVSLLLHLTVLFGMALIVSDHTGQLPFGAVLGMMDTEGGGGPLEETFDSALESRDAGTDVLNNVPVEAYRIVENNVASAPVDANVSAAAMNAAAALAGGGGSGRAGGGTGFQFSMPADGRVIRKGSFAAWTVPEDPEPNQDYVIVIQVQLPQGVKSYSPADLAGEVHGTDRYFQSIPGKAKGPLPVKDGQTQLVIKVPGAAQLVKDTIVIRSRLLREKQTLEIEF